MQASVSGAPDRGWRMDRGTHRRVVLALGPGLSALAWLLPRRRARMGGAWITGAGPGSARWGRSAPRCHGAPGPMGLHAGGCVLMPGAMMVPAALPILQVDACRTRALSGRGPLMASDIPGCLAAWLGFGIWPVWLWLWLLARGGSSGWSSPAGRSAPWFSPQRDCSGSPVSRPLSRRSAGGRSPAFPGRSSPRAPVTGMPRAGKRFGTATRIWTPATWRSKARHRAAIGPRPTRHQPMSGQLHAGHFRFDPSAAVVAAPVPPGSPPKVLRGPQGLAARPGSGAMRLPWPGLAAGRKQGGRARGPGALLPDGPPPHRGQRRHRGRRACHGRRRRCSNRRQLGRDGGDFLARRDLHRQAGSSPRRLVRTGSVHRLDIADNAGGDLGRPDRHVRHGNLTPGRFPDPPHPLTRC